MKDVNLYADADRAMKIMNRDMLRDFGKLKTSKMDELHIIRDVTRVYETQEKKARKRFLEIATEAFLLGMALCGITGRKARKAALDAITDEWVDLILQEPDLVTGYRFDRETERKTQRLAEALIAEAERQSYGTGGAGSAGKDQLIDRAIRDWSKQVGQYTIGITDDALMEAYEAAEMPEVMWVSVPDNRRCSECKERDGKIYPLNEVPPKPHWGCRCRWIPAKRVSTGQ